MASAYSRRAEQFLTDALYDSSNVYSDKAARIYLQNEIWLKYIQCITRQGRSLDGMGLFDSALVVLRSALQLGLLHCGQPCIEVADCYNNIGIVQNDRGEYEEALLHHQKALSIRRSLFGDDHPLVAQSYNNLGVVNDNKGNYDRALQYFQDALSIFLRTKHLNLAGCYNNIGIAYDHKGDYLKALEYYNKSLALIPEAARDHINVAFIYFALGDVHFNLHEYDKALLYFQKALSIRRFVLGEKHIDVAWIYYSLGNVYEQQHDYVQAFEYHDKALAIRLEFLGEHHPDAAWSYNSIGRIYDHIGSNEKALSFTQKALSILHDIFGEKHTEVSEMLQSLGKVYENQCQYTLALECYQKSLCSLHPDFTNFDFSSNPPLTDIRSELLLLNALELKANALIKRYAQASHIHDLIDAELAFTLASSVIEGIKKRYLSESSKLRIGEQANSIYEQAIAVSVQLYSLTQKDIYKEKAFLYSEKNKASVLRQSLSEIQAKQFAGIPHNLLEKERDFKCEIAGYENSLYEEQLKGKKADEGKVKAWQEKIFILKRQHEELIDQFERQYPKYYNLKYRVSTISPKIIQKKFLQNNNALIEYFIGNKNIFIFVLTNHLFEISRIEKDPHFEEYIQRMKTGLVRRNYTLFSTNAYRLYEMLINPIHNYIIGKDLIIIPDGTLGYIPFETLLTKKPDSSKQDYRKLAYLILQNQITYDYSSTLFYEAQLNPVKAAALSYKGFAPTIFK